MNNINSLDSDKLIKLNKYFEENSIKEFNSHIKSVSLEEGNELGRELYNIIASKGYNDDYEKILDLVFRGANLEYKSDKKGIFPLLVCARNNYIKTFLVLAKAGADVNQTNNYNTTATMAAARHGCLDILKVLILLGADINMRDLDGDTAITSSVIHKQKECYDVLVLNQAILTNRNINNLSIFDIDNDFKIDSNLLEDSSIMDEKVTTYQDCLDLVEEARREFTKIKNN
jgi:ankyrin repeat protein